MNETERTEFLTSKNEWVAIFRALGIEETADYNYNAPHADRILCICRGGNTRSVAAAFLLKYKYQKDAVSASFEKNGEDLLFLLAEWADTILVFEEAHFNDAVLQLNPYVQKLVLADLTGAARLRSYPFDLEFLKQVDQKLQEVGLGR